MKKSVIIVIIFTLISLKVFGEELTWDQIPKPKDGFIGIHITPILGLGIFSSGAPDNNVSSDPSNKIVNLQYLIKISYGFDEFRMLRFVVITGYLYKFFNSTWSGGYQKSSVYIIAGGFQFGFVKEPKTGIYPYAGLFVGGAFGNSESSLPVYEEDNKKFIFIVHSGFKYFFTKNIGIDFSVNFEIVPKFKWVNGKKTLLIIAPMVGCLIRI